MGHDTPDFDALSERSNYRRESQSTVAGLNVTRNKATGVKNHIIDIDKKMNRTYSRPLGLFLSNYRSASYSIVKYGRKQFFFNKCIHHTAFLLFSCYPGITWQLADDIF